MFYNRRAFFIVFCFLVAHATAATDLTKPPGLTLDSPGLSAQPLGAEFIHLLNNEQSAQRALIPKIITLATTHWCPYACEQGGEGPGMIYEYVQYVGRSLGYEINIAFFPWARAIKLAEDGNVNGLLTAVPAEAPNMVFTSTPTMSYQACFFVNAEQPWRYHNLDSLRGIRLGVIADYAYGEPVDEYIANAANANTVLTLTGDEGVGRLISLLAKKRINSFLDDKNVVLWQVNHLNRYRRSMMNVAGCLQEKPFFLALSPKFEWSKAFIALLNQAFAEQKNQAYLNSVIKPKYIKL